MSLLPPPPLTHFGDNKLLGDSPIGWTLGSCFAGREAGFGLLGQLQIRWMDGLMASSPPPLIFWPLKVIHGEALLPLHRPSLYPLYPPFPSLNSLPPTSSQFTVSFIFPMVAAPLNIQILPENGHGHPNINGHSKVRKKSGAHLSRRRNRSPKKFLVLPVEDLDCKPGNGMARGEGRIVVGKQMDGGDWPWKRGRKGEEDKQDKGTKKVEEKEEREEPGEESKSEGKEVGEERKPGEQCHCCQAQAETVPSKVRVRKLLLEESVQVPTIASPKWTTGPMPVKAKVILLGESGVGKTSLFYSLKYGCAGLLPCKATIGANHTNFELTGLGNVPVKMQLWDTAGQERFRSMVPMYLRNINAALLVYDITDRNSFEQIDFWIREISRCTALEEKAPAFVLVGNKKDQEEGLRQVDEADGMAKAAQFGAKFFEVTAIDSKAILAIFQCLADDLAGKLLPKFDEAEEVDERIELEQEEEEAGGTSMFRIEREIARELADYWKKGRGANCCPA